jgi:hypothetical protein
MPRLISLRMAGFSAMARVRGTVHYDGYQGEAALLLRCAQDLKPTRKIRPRITLEREQHRWNGKVERLILGVVFTGREVAADRVAR